MALTLKDVLDRARNPASSPPPPLSWLTESDRAEILGELGEVVITADRRGVAGGVAGLDSQGRVVDATGVPVGNGVTAVLDDDGKLTALNAVV